MRVLVCGGRTFSDWPWLYEELNKIHAKTPITMVIHGAARGADAQAGAWARDVAIPCLSVPAQWDRYGKSAGFIRNAQMLTYDPDLVVAFPGGSGTSNMISKANGKGIPVVLISRSPSEESGPQVPQEPPLSPGQ